MILEQQPLLQPHRTTPVLRWYHYAVLIVLDMLGPFSSDSYLVNLPDVVADLSTTDFLASFTIQINWIVSGIATISLGAASDRLGRKPILFFSLLCYIAGTLGCGISPTINVFIIFRIIQGIGEGSAVLSSAIVRDVLDDPAERVKLLAILGGLRPIMIVTAPTIGGIIGTVLGWRTLFYILSGMGIVVLILVIFTIPETNEYILNPEGRISEELWHVRLRNDLKHILSNGLFVWLCISETFASASIMSMLSNISFIFSDYYMLSRIISGFCIGSIPLVGMMASLLARPASKYISPGTMLRLSYGLQPIASSFLLISAWKLYSYTYWSFLGPCMLGVTIRFFSMPSSQSIILQPFKSASGTASGINNLCWKIFGAIASIVVTEFFDDTPKYVLIGMGCFSTLSILTFWFTVSWRQLDEHD